LEKNLASLKFEYPISKGYFISNKTYALLLDDGTIIKKGKGFSTDSVSLFEYEQMYLYSQSIEANRISGKINYSLGSVMIDNKKIIIDWNSYIKREKIYDFKTNIWTDTRALYYDNLTRTITVYIKKDIINFTRPLDFEFLTSTLTVYIPKIIIKYSGPLDFEKLTRSITVYVKKKNIIKYSRPFNSYNVTKCFSVYDKDSKYLKNTIPLYKYNLSRDILNYDKKYIIKFISTSDQKPKVILDLCNARNQKLNDRQRFDNVDANADKKKNINKNYLNIIWLIGIVLSLGAPSLIYKMTGVNIYDQYYINESIYSNSVIKIRITCATVFLYSIFLFVPF